MVDEIWLFGPYARGAQAPGDLDLEIIITPDEKYQRDEVQAFFGHRHPGIDFLRELRGRRRGFEIGISPPAKLTSRRRPSSIEGATICSRRWIGSMRSRSTRVPHLRSVTRSSRNWRASTRS